MAKRPDISVILLYSRGVVRADFNRGQRVPVFKRQESLDVESTITEAVEQVVVGHTTIASRAVVLSTDVWSQIITLPRLSVSGIDPADLDEVLKFETETLSGIEIDEISLASIPLGQQDELQRYWVSAIRSTDLHAVHRVLESAGCREIVVAHPAGLSGDPKSSSATSIEVWNELAYFMEEHSSKLVKVKQASVDQFHPEHRLLLGMDAVPCDIDSNIEARQLADESCFDEWAGQVARNYLRRERDLNAPLIRLAKARSGVSLRHLLSGIIALAVVGFCFWHWNSMRLHNEAVAIQIADIQKPADEKKKYDSQLISILETRAELETEDAALGDDLKRIQFSWKTKAIEFPNYWTCWSSSEHRKWSSKKSPASKKASRSPGSRSTAKRPRRWRNACEKTVPLGWAVNPRARSANRN